MENPHLSTRDRSSSSASDRERLDAELARWVVDGGAWEVSRMAGLIESLLNCLAAVERERDEARLTAKAVVIAPFAMRCMTCGTAAHQPNDRCEAHISFPDRLQTEVEMHNAWRKRATDAEAALLSLQTAIQETAQNWQVDAQLLRQNKGQRTREKRGHEVLEACAYGLAALLPDPARTTHSKDHEDKDLARAHGDTHAGVDRQDLPRPADRR